MCIDLFAWTSGVGETIVALNAEPLSSVPDELAKLLRLVNILSKEDSNTLFCSSFFNMKESKVDLSFSTSTTEA